MTSTSVNPKKEESTSGTTLSRKVVRRRLPFSGAYRRRGAPMPDGIRCEIDSNECDELMATKKESAPDPDGIPYSLNRCAGGLGSSFYLRFIQHIFAGGLVPFQFAAGRTVFIPKSSEVDNNGFMMRSPDALRPLTLCNCDCKILTTAICRGLQWYTMRYIHPSQR